MPMAPTATALGMRALAAFGARVDFLVPNRFEYGYGLTRKSSNWPPSASRGLIVTVDNGIASVEGVNAARARGIDILITDHHLPGEVLPDALIIESESAWLPVPFERILPASA